MSQEELLALLKEHPNKWVTSTELKRRLKVGANSMNANLNKLYQNRDVLRKIKKDMPKYQNLVYSYKAR